MTEAGDEHGWQVSLLVPHPTRLAVLVGDSGPSPSVSTLPTLRTGPEPPLAEIMASVDAVDPATSVPLRLSMSTARAVGVETALLLELDAVAVDAPAGWAHLAGTDRRARRPRAFGPLADRLGGGDRRDQRRRPAVEDGLGAA